MSNGQLMSVEDAVHRIDRIVDAAIDDFVNMHRRMPSLMNADDYLLWRLCPSEVQDACAGKMSKYDVAFRAIRKYLEGQGFFGDLGEEQSAIFDGLIGRVHYNPPPREYEFRIKRLKELQERGVPFPADYPKLIEKVEAIRKVNAGLLEHPKTNPQDRDVFLNPTAMIIQRSRIIATQDYESFINEWGYDINFLDGLTECPTQYR